MRMEYGSSGNSRSSGSSRPRFGFGNKTAADGPSRFPRKRVRRFGNQVIQNIDYKNVDVLRNFISEKGKILPRRIAGLSSKEQRMLARAVKRARHSGFLAFQQP